MASECYGCGDEYTYLNRHWTGETIDCGFPEPTERERSIIRGLMLGDASLCRSNSRPYLQISVVSELFLEWCADQLWRFGPSVNLVETASEVAERVNQTDWSDGLTENDCSDVHQLRTVGHPVFEEFDWYEDGVKRFPDDLSVDALSAKLWYVCDGDLKNSNRESHSEKPRITCRTEDEQPQFLLDLFRQHGFDPYWDELPSKVCFRVSEVDEFFDWIGESVPGFGYKWPTEG